MADRIVETEYDRKMLLRFIENQKLPFTATVVAGKHRTTEQNKLQRLWVKEIAEQAPGSFESAEHVRGYCKLHFGVPILRNEDDTFCREYDAVIRPLAYELKLKLMMVPFDFGVTRIMTTKQKTAYLDMLHRHFSEQGIVLTDPEDRRIAA